MNIHENRTPPRWVDRWLEWLIADRFIDETLGDLYEWYQLHQTKSSFWLSFNYGLAAIRSLKPYRLKSTQNIILYVIDMSLLNNNIKIGFRSILKNGFFSSINLIGLTTALTCALFIYAYVLFENSYHDFHAKGDSIYRILKVSETSGGMSRATTTPLVPAIQTEFPGSVSFARFGHDPVFMTFGERSFYEADFFWADSTLFTMFDLEFLYGSGLSSLNSPNKIVLTEEVSIKYFGEGVNPVGKMMEIKVYDGDQHLSMQVDGVLKKLPPNQDFPFEVLGSMTNALDMYRQFENSWGFNWLHTYALVENPNDLERLKAGSLTLLSKYADYNPGSKMSLKFQPLKETHLHSQDIGGANNSGNIKHVIALIAIGIFIVLIASINYVNMMTARLYRRGKEVGIRKVNGASRPQLMKLFLTESGIVVFSAAVLAFALTWVLWLPFTAFIGKEIPLDVLFSGRVVLSYGLIIVGLILMAGGYPAWVLSSLDMNKMIKGIHERISRVQLRRILVVLQFGISAFLILCTLVIWDQVSYMSNKDLGFDKDQLMVVSMESKDLQSRIEIVKEEMNKLPDISSVAISGESLPSAMNNGWGISWGVEKSMGINVVTIGPDYFKTIDTRILSGENLTKPYRMDSARSIVINEAAKKAMDLDEAVGQTVELGGKKRKIVGVVQDFHYKSLHDLTDPVVYLIGTPGNRISADNLIIRLQSENVINSVDKVAGVWETFAPNEIFNFHFVDQSYQEAYNNETRFLQLLGGFSILSILIAAIGLFGMVTFLTDERSKELSIRKVLGAGIKNIVILVSGEFTLLVCIGFAIALPLGILTSESWLEKFPYRTELSLWTIFAAALGLLFIAWMTISFNTIKTAISSPIRFLRNE